MSQVSNKVKWCINKAKRELEEGKKQRGLVEKEPEDSLARKHIGKSEHNYNAALFFAKNKYSDWSVSAFFYSIYHCFLAIAAKFGYESGNQECTIALVEMLKEERKIELDDKFINTLKIEMKDEVESLIEIREEFQYGTEQVFKEQERFDNLSKMCKDCIDQAKDIIY